MKLSSPKVEPPITVTQTYLPPLAEYTAYLERIWADHWVTNNGPLVRELEARLRVWLGVEHLWYVGNCTVALQLALKALNLSGEIITTPFSYVATTGVPMWESCTPVFVDVLPNDLTLNPELVEAAITPRTTAILATHVYGYPCDVDALGAIAKRHGLKLVFDAAHAFGCRLRGRPLAAYGDISCLSFHATKVFHTVEGGAILANGNPELSERIRLMRGFGHHGDDHHCIGINGKNSELHAAMGLCNLPHVGEIIAARRHQHELYRRLLQIGAVNFPSSSAEDFEYNYAYCPVLLPSEAALLRVIHALAARGVIPRRYFYPSLNRLPYVHGSSCPVSESASSRVLCLPMSLQVSDSLIREIAEVVIRACA